MSGSALRELDLVLACRMERLRRWLLGEAGDGLRVGSVSVSVSCRGPDSGELCSALPSFRLRRLDGWADCPSSSSGSDMTARSLDGRGRRGGAESVGSGWFVLGGGVEWKPKAQVVGLRQNGIEPGGRQETAGQAGLAGGSGSCGSRD